MTHKMFVTDTENNIIIEALFGDKKDMSISINKNALRRLKDLNKNNDLSNLINEFIEE